MATTDNPMVTMTGQMNLEAGDEDVPNPEFLESALPGFKQTLTARRSIRVFDGEPIAALHAGGIVSRPGTLGKPSSAARASDREAVGRDRSGAVDSRPAPDLTTTVGPWSWKHEPGLARTRS